MRVVSATARDLTEEIAEGRFREDLYYRLNVVPVTIPPLAERREDIPALVEHFIAHYAAERRVPTPEIAPDAMAALQSLRLAGQCPPAAQRRRAHDHPGAGRPDRRGSTSTCCRPKCWASRARSGGGDATAIMGAPLREARETFEREYLRVQIRRFSGNISRTASFIGMERSALHRKLKLLGITDSRDE